MPEPAPVPDLPRPTCRRCGERLNLAPLWSDTSWQKEMADAISRYGSGIAEPSVDAVNLANGVPLCQPCLLALEP